MRKIVIPVFIFLILSIVSCSPWTKTPPTPGQVPVATPQAPAREAWQEQWEKALSKAKKEGKVVIYGTLGGETTTALGKAFREKFGIAAEYVGGGGGEIAQKILTERRAGIYVVDLWQGGAASALNLLKPARAFDPVETALILPEVIDQKAWINGQLEFVDKDRIILSYWAYAVPPIALNIKLVRPEDIKSFRDILAPRWKGKISLQDPTVGGTGQSWFHAFKKIMSLDFMQELAKQELIITRDRRLQVEWLAQGKYPIAIAPQSDILGTFEGAGAPVKKHLTPEGTFWSSGSGNIILMNRTPHPNAAKIYLNWLLGREAQTIHTRVSLLPSARADVPTEGLDPYNLIQPGIKYINGNTEEFRTGQMDDVKYSREIFGHLMR